jgi:hypothetical protein
VAPPAVAATDDARTAATWAAQRWSTVAAGYSLISPTIMSAATETCSGDSSRPTCRVSSAGCQPARQARFTDIRSGSTRPRLTARVQAGVRSLASSVKALA